MYICTLSEILMSDNSSACNAIYLYFYILCMDGILVERILMDLKFISCKMCRESIQTI